MKVKIQMSNWIACWKTGGQGKERLLLGQEKMLSQMLGRTKQRKKKWAIKFCSIIFNNSTTVESDWSINQLINEVLDQAWRRRGRKDNNNCNTLKEALFRISSRVTLRRVNWNTKISSRFKNKIFSSLSGAETKTQVNIRCLLLGISESRQTTAKNLNTTLNDKNKRYMYFSKYVSMYVCIYLYIELDNGNNNKINNNGGVDERRSHWSRVSVMSRQAQRDLFPPKVRGTDTTNNLVIGQLDVWLDITHQDSKVAQPEKRWQAFRSRPKCDLKWWTARFGELWTTLTRANERSETW